MTRKFCTRVQPLLAKAPRHVVCYGLGALLFWSSLWKIRYPHSFLSAVYSYELVNPRVGLLVAIVLPSLELILGTCLLLGLFRGGAMLGTCVLSGVFVFVQASALWRGLDISCGCFYSPGRDTVSFGGLLVSILILGAAFAVFAWPLFHSQGFGRKG